MTTRTLTPEIGQQLGLESDVKGAVVMEVEPFGPAGMPASVRVTSSCRCRTRR